MKKIRFFPSFANIHSNLKRYSLEFQHLDGQVLIRLPGLPVHNYTTVSYYQTHR